MNEDKLDLIMHRTKPLNPIRQDQSKTHSARSSKDTRVSFPKLIASKLDDSAFRKNIKKEKLAIDDGKIKLSKTLFNGTDLENSQNDYENMFSNLIRGQMLEDHSEIFNFMSSIDLDSEIAELFISKNIRTLKDLIGKCLDCRTRRE